jgi:dynein heavy chain 2
MSDILFLKLGVWTHFLELLTLTQGSGPIESSQKHLDKHQKFHRMKIVLIIVDGDVDPVWIESLNSVLNDNRLLTLPTNESIQFGSNVKFIFETHSFEFASPSTVSRVGVIFVSSSDFDVKLTIPQLCSNSSEASNTFSKKIISLLLQNFKNLSKDFVFPLNQFALIKNIIPFILDSANEQDFGISICH